MQVRQSWMGEVCRLASAFGLAACGAAAEEPTESGTVTGGVDAGTVDPDVAGESDDESDEGADDPSGEDGEDSGPPCEAAGFASEAIAWSLPQWADATFAFDDIANPATCGEQPTYALADLTGDGQPDLVVTHACDDGGLGIDQWVVFAGEGEGFGEAQAWALPEWPATIAPFPAVPTQSQCSEGRPASALTDLTGDGRADLVITDACGDGDVGTMRWLVFENTGAGFGDAIAWRLPAWPAEAPPFSALANPEACAVGVPASSLVDLGGDGLADLVVTSACGDAGLGAEQWLVFANVGDGFASEGASWTLPPWPTTEPPFPGLGGTADCTAGAPSYAVFDLGGDGPPELVVTWACGDGDVGRANWLAFANDGSGFGAAVEWTLPEWPADAEPFPALGSNADCRAGVPSTGTTDLTGDGRPDLVVTWACGDGGLGDTRWLVAPGGEGAFGELVDWELPSWPAAESFVALADGANCDDGTPTFALIDLDGSTTPGLTITYACGDGGIGDSQWLYFPSACGH